MKTFVTALLVLGTSATRVESFLKQGDYRDHELPECTQYCSEGYFYTKTWWDCSSKTDMLNDFYVPTPQCPVYCKVSGNCPVPNDASHKAALEILEQFDLNGDGKITTKELAKVISD